MKHVCVCLGRLKFSACHPQTREQIEQFCNAPDNAEIQHEPVPKLEWQAVCIQGSSPVCPHSPPCKHITGHLAKLRQAPHSTNYPVSQGEGQVDQDEGLRAGHWNICPGGKAVPERKGWNAAGEAGLKCKSL